MNSRLDRTALDTPEGTIYPALHRLEERGWVASSWTRVSGRRRRVYALTDRGHRQLAVQRREWVRFRTAMGVVLGTEPA